MAVALFSFLNEIAIMMHLPTNKRFTTIADVIAILRTECIDYVLYIMRTKRKPQLDAI